MRFLGKILVAEYMRLSREDGDKVESDSISNQRELIKDYLSRHKELKFVSEYVDDGHSGVSFERPAFQRMMEDVRAGKVNCIIVKDLSRFGRNYIETGRYMEKIFPCMGVVLYRYWTIMTVRVRTPMQTELSFHSKISSMILTVGIFL